MNYRRDVRKALFLSRKFDPLPASFSNLITNNQQTVPWLDNGSKIVRRQSLAL